MEFFWTHITKTHMESWRLYWYRRLMRLITQWAGSPWSPQRPDKTHREHSRRQCWHHQGWSPRCCISPWPCSSGRRWRCRAASSSGGHTESQTGPDPRHSGKSGRGSRNFHSNLRIILLLMVPLLGFKCSDLQTPQSPQQLQRLCFHILVVRLVGLSEIM